MKVYIPLNYKAILNEYDTQGAIAFIKEAFQKNFYHNLNLKRVSAPLFVSKQSGLNDDLNGYERPVSFDALSINEEIQIVHSLAKWKRLALKKYNFKLGEGLCTDMNAIRRDEELDNFHSIYVDQWDWEKIISKENRNIEFFKSVVKDIVRTICDTNEQLDVRYPQLNIKLNRNVYFIDSQVLEEQYPNLTPTERENEITRKYHTVCILRIGHKLKSGIPHSNRAPDYDDWNLNGDILFYHETLDKAIEISSMGIRVNKESLIEQLKLSNKEERLNYYFHKLLLQDELPLTIGGGIGQSRLCMLMLGSAHIGEVQSSLWDEENIKAFEENNIRVL